MRKILQVPMYMSLYTYTRNHREYERGAFSGILLVVVHILVPGFLV